MVNFKAYAFISVLATAAVVSNAWVTRRQFYSTTIFLTKNKISVLVLGNLGFMLTVMVGKILKTIFLGTLTRSEVEELVVNSKYAITETCLALTIFREELNSRVLVLFTALLFTKIFHWLAQMRVENVARERQITWLTHVRLQALVGFLTALDLGVVFVIFMLTNDGPSVLLLFAFEFLILSVMAIATGLKYALLCIDSSMEGRWENKSAWMFFLEFIADLVRLFLYLLFFMIICTYYGLPLHLIRELYITFHNLRERLSHYIQYRRITRNMNERFADATAEDLLHDSTCIICFEDIADVNQHAKRLDCGHIFHFHCLRTWLERQQRCPTCRANIAAVERRQPTVQPPDAEAGGVPGAVPREAPAQPQAPGAAPYVAGVPPGAAGWMVFPPPPVAVPHGHGLPAEQEEKKGEAVPGSARVAPMYMPMMATPHAGFALPPLDPRVPQGTVTAQQFAVMQQHTMALQQHVMMLRNQLAAAQQLYENQLQIQETLAKHIMGDQATADSAPPGDTKDAGTEEKEAKTKSAVDAEKESHSHRNLSVATGGSIPPTSASLVTPAEAARRFDNEHKKPGETFTPLWSPTGDDDLPDEPQPVPAFQRATSAPEMQEIRKRRVAKFQAASAAAQRDRTADS